MFELPRHTGKNLTSDNDYDNDNYPPKSRFLGNGLSRTAMLFKIATLAGHRLTIPEMNRFKEVNPRQLEHVYEEVVRMGDPGNALFALRLILKS